MGFYAYIHARPATTDSSGVFYVGKGVGARYRVLPARNRYHGFVLAKHGAENILTGKLSCSSEEIAFDLERGLIKCLRRAEVALCNMTDGGEGSSGYRMPPEVLEKIRIASTLLGQDPDVKARRRAATLRENAKRWSDPEYAARTAQAMRGKKKTRSEASDAARRANAKKSQTPEANAKKAAASKAMWADPVKRARILESRAKKSRGEPVFFQL